jgi:hypothetical protein
MRLPETHTTGKWRFQQSPLCAQNQGTVEKNTYLEAEYRPLKPFYNCLPEQMIRVIKHRSTLSTKYTAHCKSIEDALFEKCRILAVHPETGLIKPATVYWKLAKEIFRVLEPGATVEFDPEDNGHCSADHEFVAISLGEIVEVLQNWNGAEDSCHPLRPLPAKRIRVGTGSSWC